MNKRYSANIYVIISILLGYFLSQVVFKEYINGVHSALQANILNITNNIVITFIPFVIFAVFNRRKPAKIFKKIPARKMCFYIFITPAVWCVSNYLNSEINVILKNFDLKMIEQLPKGNDSEILISGFVLTCIVAPIFEELFYRGAVLSLLKGYGKGAAVFLSAFLFAIAHRSITVFGAPFVLGIVTAYITVNCGSIWPAIIIHFVNNLLSWSLMSFTFGTEITAIISIATIIMGAAWLIWAVIKILKDGRAILSALRQTIGYFKNPLWLPIVINYIYTNTLIHG